MAQAPEVDLSVVLCTWNNAARLRQTLEAFCDCKAPVSFRWELVLVNNNCTDDTPQAVEDFSGRLPVVEAFEPESGLSKARNAGLQKARGQLVLFADDDVRPCPEWLMHYWDAYRNRPSGYYFGGPVRSEFESKPPPEDLLRLATPSVRGLNWGEQERVLNAQEYFIGANWACSMDELVRAGGFNDALGLNPSMGQVRVGEETDLMIRLRRNGLQGWYLPQAELVHFVPEGKCTLRHIAGREEASQAYRAATAIEEPPVVMLWGAPRWVYRMAFGRWLRWIWAKLRGSKGYPEYLLYRGTLGSIRGYREASRWHPAPGEKKR